MMGDERTPGLAGLHYCLIAVILGLAGCNSQPIVRGDVGDQAFWQYPADLVIESLDEQRVARILSDSLSRRGWLQQDGEGRWAIRFSIQDETRYQARQLPGSLGGGPGEIYYDPYPASAMTISLVSTGDRAMVWKGVARWRLDNLAGPQERQQRISEAIEAALNDAVNRFPLPGQLSK